MWPFSKRARLLRLVKDLAVFNDKGVWWGKYTLQEAHDMRTAKIAKVKSMMSKLDRESLPTQFLEAVESGALAVDSTGRFIDVLENHFRGLSAA